jgi:hypothetical protein
MPRVGIFWNVSGRILIDSTAVGDAEDYGDFKTHGRSHEEYWDELVRLGAVSDCDDYEEYPRGRMVYNTITRQFTLYADRCILVSKALVKQIMRELNLPVEETIISTDCHYRCFGCLRRGAEP